MNWNSINFCPIDYRVESYLKAEERILLTYYIEDPKHPHYEQVTVGYFLETLGM